MPCESLLSAFAPHGESRPSGPIPAMTDPLRVLLVEDHAMVAMATRLLLEDLGCTVVGPAPTIAEAARLAERHPPDLALIDVRLPDGNGLDLAARLQDAGVRCAVLSADDRPADATGVAASVPWIDKLAADAGIRRLLAALFPGRTAAAARGPGNPR